MKKIKIALATLVLAGSALTAAAPANADITWGRAQAQESVAKKGWPGGSIDYWRYYGGSVRYINYWCNDTNNWQSVWPGQWSKSTCADVDGIYVESGSKLFCGERYGLRDYVYYPGYHAIGNFAYRACEKRAHNG